MTPPPGWYPDPSAPHLVRWWDGTAWTDHRRPAETPPEPPQPVFRQQPQPRQQAHQPQPLRPDEGQPVRPDHGQVMPPAPWSAPPSGPSPVPAAGGRTSRLRVVVPAAAGTALVAAIAAGAVLLTRNGGDGTGAVPATASASATSTATASAPAAPSDAPPSPPTSGDDPSVAVDQLNGITLPVPDGWEKPDRPVDDDVVMTTVGTYDCPAGTSFCRHGQVSTHTSIAADGTTPEALAKGDIADAADTAYERNGAGERLYGGITSHQLVKSGQVAVAGRAGYFVRWRVHTAQGPGGYVESLAFPSSVGTQAPLVVRFALDAGPDGPPLSDIDTITRGIRPVDDAATGGGVGSSIGPHG
ncbi:DUF2510 domain-containing protein [Streptomyces mexicanus]|uniref:DUF2510 domain-containing protein n=1 Tax=Streptomyces mexicanus TaxID=178566 RepID=A0A7X1I0S9_9ACTN|nr:DUF2510 domain-containing protein [Streptomyces mexicanus]MBC2866730.1 DUF2510 domain-containing protein [Streptomyces mexicanus]